MLRDAATILYGSAPSSAPSSPKQRLKFFCSHGGKILPRPTDGQLKYVGGETRVISVPRDIPFQEVMKRLTYLIDGEMILKYQLVWEDLDALVCVKSDEDLSHMYDEIEHYEFAGCPRMRAFLFPANHHVVMEHLLPEQRYIYSINGINTKQLIIASLASSACSSPRSPYTYTFTPENSMHKILSSPTICCNNLRRNAVAAQERLVSAVRSVGRDSAPSHQAHHCNYYANNSREINRGNRCCTKYMHMHGDCNPFSDTRIIERQATLP